MLNGGTCLRNVSVSIIFYLPLGLLIQLEAASEKAFMDHRIINASSLMGDPRNYLGRGFKSLTRSVTGSRVVQVPENIMPAPPQRGFRCLIKEIENQTSLRETLNISASASILGGGSGGASFYRSHSFDKLSVYIYVDCTSITEEFSMAEYPLVAEAKAAMEAKQDQIYGIYGDCFIGEVAMGGHYSTIIRYEAQTETEYAKLSEDASGSTGEFEVSEHASASIEKLHAYKSTSIWSVLDGVAGGPPDMKDVVPYVTKFPDKVAQDNVRAPIQIGTYSIGEAKGWQVGINAPDATNADQTLALLADTREQTNLLIKQWGYVRDHLPDYVVQQADVITMLEGLDGINAQIEKAARTLTDDPTSPLPAAIMIPELYRALPFSLKWVTEVQANQWEWAKEFIDSQGPSDLTGIQMVWWQDSGPFRGNDYRLFISCRADNSGCKYEVESFPFPQGADPTNKIKSLAQDPDIRLGHIYNGLQNGLFWVKKL